MTQWPGPVFEAFLSQSDVIGPTTLVFVLFFFSPSPRKTTLKHCLRPCLAPPSPVLPHFFFRCPDGERESLSADRPNSKEKSPPTNFKILTLNLPAQGQFVGAKVRYKGRGEFVVQRKEIKSKAIPFTVLLSRSSKIHSKNTIKNKYKYFCIYF